MLSAVIKMGIRVHANTPARLLMEKANKYLQDFFPMARVATAYSSFSFSSFSSFSKAAILTVDITLSYPADEWHAEANRLCLWVANEISEVEGSRHPFDILYVKYT